MNDLLWASEETLISILVLLNFSKAFDSVYHQLLCSKLSCQYLFYQRCWPYKVLSLRPKAKGLDRKSGIRDPASHIRCRTGISRPTAFFIIHQRYHERYCIMSISPVCRRRTIYISCHLSDYVDFISRLNLDLEYTTVVIAKLPLNQRGQISGHGGWPDIKSMPKRFLHTEVTLANVIGIFREPENFLYMKWNCLSLDFVITHSLMRNHFMFWSQEHRNWVLYVMFLLENISCH
jgi:hypothetical protein